MDTTPITGGKRTRRIPTSKSNWLCIPCFDGLLAIPQSEYSFYPPTEEKLIGRILFLQGKSQVSVEDLNGRGALLPGGCTDHIFFDELPLPIQLLDEEILELSLYAINRLSLRQLLQLYMGLKHKKKKVMRIMPFLQ